VRQRVARSRELVGQGRPAAVVARVAGISRQAIYRPLRRPPVGQRRPLAPIDRVVLDVCARQPDRRHPDSRRPRVAGSRRGGQPQARAATDARTRPAATQALRGPPATARLLPGHAARRALASRHDWVAEHGWCYLNAAIDCCTREIVGWALDVRCRAAEASTVIEAAVAERVIGPGELTLGTDNGTAFTSRAFRTRLAEHRIVRRRGGYRDPESQAFIESGFSKLKQRCVWREEFETLDEARERIGAYIDGYHHRPHQGLAYRTPREVAATWKDHDDQSIPAA